ncbi:MAG: hypothetical protein U9Q04_05685 [Campylobacterota bacterium]|nr:hypothetical protein [Campylobacterota bacterium]
MIVDIIEDVSYKNLVETQIFELIEYLINKDEEFSVTANISGVSFDPEIPQSISENFQKFTMFTLMNYTFDTLELTEENIKFEAGFGAENFGSEVTVPLTAIFQIVVDESILFINPTATLDKNFQSKKEETPKDQNERSMNAFKMNKKNKDLF